MALFDGVHYHIATSISYHRRNDLASLLDNNGAVRTDPSSSSLTHVITNTTRYEGHERTSREGVALVTPLWVEKTMMHNKPMLPRYYSPDTAMIFSGTVVCATDIPATDVEVLSAGVSALGGQWRIGLTRDVTHLIAVHTNTDKYATAMHFRHMTQIKVVTPHWFEDSVRLGVCMPADAYEWPDPKVMQPGFGADADEGKVDENGRRVKRSKKNGLGAEEDGDGDGDGEEREAPPPVWAGKKIMLSSSLELSERNRESIEERIRSFEGLPVRVEPRAGLDDEDAIDEAEERAVDDCDVLITKYRSGKAFFKALRKGILIGTLSWFFNVCASGTLVSSLDSLLWYPTPRLPISGLEGMQITITNYTGPARDYLKRVIELTGAEFTPQLSPSNKVLIAGYQPSPKAQRAVTWSIPIVNHTWLEDCFVQWRNLTVGNERYVVFPNGVDFGQLLVEAEGKNGIVGCRTVLPIDDIEAEEERDKRAREAIKRARERERAEAEAKAQREREREAMAENGADGGMEGDVDGTTEARTPRSPQKVSGTTKSASSPFKAAASAFTPRNPFSPTKPRPSAATPSKAAPPGVTARMKTKSPAKLRAATPPAKRTSQLGMSASIREVEDDLRMDVDGGNDDDEDDDDDEPLSPNKRARPAKLQYPVKPRTVETELEGDEEQEDVDVDVQIVELESAKKGKGREKEKEQRITRSSPKKPARTEVPSEMEEDDDDDEIPVTLTRKAREQQQQPKTQPKKSTHHSAVRSESEEEVGEPELTLGPAKLSKAKSTAKASPTRSSPRKKAAPTETSDSEVYRSPPKTKAKTTAASKMKAKGRTALESEEDDEEDDRSIRSVSPLPKSRARAQSKAASPAKAKAKPVYEEVEEEEEEASPLPPPAKKNPIRKRGSSFIDAVVITTPSPRKKSKAPADAKAAADGAGTSKLDRAGSLRAAAAESGTNGSPRAKRGQPSPAPKSPAKEKNKRKPDEDMEDEEEETEGVVDTTLTDAEMSYTLTHGRAKRSAATKATTKLRNEIMPDVMNFEKERKNAKRRGSEAFMYHGYQESERSEYVESERASAVGGAKGKGKRTRGEEDDEGESEVQEVPAPTASKGRANKRSKKEVEEDEEDGEDTSHAKGKAHGNASPPKSGGKQVTILTTGVTLSEDVLKRLSKLGVRTTQTAVQCTHLVVKNVVRTEKFLSAMAVAPFIVTEEWAKDSAKAGTLLPEKGYFISDKVSEKKWNFKLADALERAGNGAGTRLFKGMVFYVTPKVPIDTKLLKNVVAAGGGTVQNGSPTVRSLKGKENRYVVSCPEDISIWRPIAQEGYSVYTAEMLLLAILRQEIGWDDESTKVPGSY